ncbi:MAG: hypothetical protein UX80_C0017G0003 [Candidatus Amesbacteria bacterium GW2011_GWA2_47_11b]|uniref:DUF86 domain-containing protein n=3 Tax=Candidatus Amesiibacteriota TaxID=1752730 RepID=A0A0G1SGN1_9BACT|nr:MAG: hypothetical protein UX42_C0024G0012 [Microgenomates group bacterium GW2011_GWC1_46_20]KKU57385.1 MAG: hypothetical protein UX80_C0017G0003 [Candidatus Amesbacteria bacterium GW2011_GWA2_47_11b]KKU68581.1 MAG: hypothetical protein UX92_C0019G0016 [Candidatus Amesbacteria bacterium GW2011_GWA1_47_20]KKU82959.1 MAG: hypothetical protein UY11_C0034G0012 [Candidatus Amesbacteria bacterium GW2011_GWC2_47_8]
MTQLPIEKDVVLKRMEGIQTELTELVNLGKQDLATFSSGSGWKLAQFHLHRALEGVFNISSHLLSRIPGATATQYKEIALKMGEFGFVPADFAQTRLTEMAKYRNRLVHFYAQVTAEELYKIIRDDLKDFDVFLQAVKATLASPK